MLHWTPEFETPGNSSYTLWAGVKPMYLLSRDNAGKWEMYKVQDSEGAVKLCNWSTLEKAKNAAWILADQQIEDFGDQYRRDIAENSRMDSV